MRFRTVVPWIVAFGLVALAVNVQWPWGPVILLGGVTCLLFVVGFIRGKNDDTIPARWLFFISLAATLGFAFWDYLIQFIPLR